MASAFRRRSGKGCATWYAAWRSETGAWKQLATTAQTKTAALKLARELEAQAERRRFGLEALPAADGGGLLSQLLARWLEAREDSPNHERESYVVSKHLLAQVIAARPLSQVSSPGRGKPDGREEEEPGAPKSVNHLRAIISRAFNVARRRGWWTGGICADVRPLKVPRPTIGDYLRPEEARAVLSQLDARWRPLFAAAIYTGMRKGELLSIRKSDVDLKRQLLRVGRFSWERDTTKGGHAEFIPIHTELVPYLGEALARSPSDLVFPHVCYPSCRGCPGLGAAMRPDVALESVLRRAMARAGIVLGYLHVCRGRKGTPCTERQEALENGARRCPRHGLLMWPKPQVRPIRFHDLRHTTASLLLQANVPMHVVQRLLRHKDPRLTANTYGHLSRDYMQTELSKLSLTVGAGELSAPSLHAEQPEGFSSRRRGEKRPRSDYFRSEEYGI